MFAERLKDLRKNSGLLQKDMADKIGITKSAYGYYEQGKTIPDIVTTKKIADILNVSVDYLLGVNADGAQKDLSDEKKKFLELMEEISDDEAKKLLDIYLLMTNK